MSLVLDLTIPVSNLGYGLSTADWGAADRSVYTEERNLKRLLLAVKWINAWRIPQRRFYWAERIKKTLQRSLCSSFYSKGKALQRSLCSSFYYNGKALQRSMCNSFYYNGKALQRSLCSSFYYNWKALQWSLCSSFYYNGKALQRSKCSSLDWNG